MVNPPHFFWRENGLDNVITWPQSTGDTARIPHKSYGFTNQCICLVRGVQGRGAREGLQARDRYLDGLSTWMAVDSLTDEERIREDSIVREGLEPSDSGQVFGERAAREAGRRPRDHYVMEPKREGDSRAKIVVSEAT